MEVLIFKGRASGLKLACGLLLGMLGCLAGAQQQEHDVKAAFLYNFSKYVTWPSSALKEDEVLVFGVVGQSNVTASLENAVDGKTIDGRKLKVRRISWSQIGEVHILFVPASEMDQASQLSKIKDKPVLTVGEAGGFARKFGIINFVLESNRVRFEINANSAKEAGLSVSSKLLSLGKAPGK